jgi:aldehyde:ferredoxin oxidoreductase
MLPKLSLERIAEFISLSLGIDLSSSDLEGLASKVISETVKAGKKEGEVHPSLKMPEFENNLKELQVKLAE